MPQQSTHIYICSYIHIYNIHNKEADYQQYLHYLVDYGLIPNDQVINLSAH